MLQYTRIQREHHNCPLLRRCGRTSVDLLSDTPRLIEVSSHLNASRRYTIINNMWVLLAHGIASLSFFEHCCGEGGETEY